MHFICNWALNNFKNIMTSGIVEDTKITQVAMEKRQNRKS